MKRTTCDMKVLFDYVMNHIDIESDHQGHPGLGLRVVAVMMARP